MKLQRLAIDGDSDPWGCPAVYVAIDDPTVLVVQGKLLDAETTTELRDLAADETAVRIKTETVERALRQATGPHEPT